MHDRKIWKAACLGDEWAIGGTSSMGASYSELFHRGVHIADISDRDLALTAHVPRDFGHPGDIYAISRKGNWEASDLRSALGTLSKRIDTYNERLGLAQSTAESFRTIVENDKSLSCLLNAVANGNLYGTQVPISMPKGCDGFLMLGKDCKTGRVNVAININELNLDVVSTAISFLRTNILQERKV